MILVDTSVWIDFLQGRDTAHRHTLHRLIEEEEEICLTGIVLVEILQGIKVDKEAREIKDDLLAFPFYNPSEIDTYIEAANIYRQCMKNGKTVRKTIDCLIAAIAIENGLTLFHNDRDFSSIEQCTELKILSVVY